MKAWAQRVAALPPRPGRRGGYALEHRLFRALWGVAWATLASWTPPPLHGWRRALLRAFGAQIAPDAAIYGSSRVWLPPNLAMREGSVLGPRAHAYAMGRIEIGPHATVSQDAELCAGTHLVDDPDFRLVTRPIVIGAHAWVAAKAFVGPGVTIGSGAVLGAGAVAMRDLEPWTIYVGNPARPVRPRRWPDDRKSLDAA